MTALLDTNVIVRFLTGNADERFKGVLKFFQDIEVGVITVELKLIVLFQTIFVLKSFYEVPKHRIIEAVNGILRLKGLRVVDKRIIQKTLEIWESENIEIVDAYLIACVEKDPQNIIYSYDRHFDKFNVKRIEP